MDGAIESMVCTLSEDEDNKSSVSERLRGGVHQFKCVHLMVVYTSDVDLTGVNMVDNSVITNNSTVSSPIHEGASLAARVCADIVSDDRLSVVVITGVNVVHVYLAW